MRYTIELITHAPKRGLTAQTIKLSTITNTITIPSDEPTIDARGLCAAFNQSGNHLLEAHILTFFERHISGELAHGNIPNPYIFNC